MNIPDRYIKAVGRYEPIQIDGLTLYPILMKDYELFSSARPAIEVMQQTFPVQYAIQPLLSAYYSMDIDALIQGEQPVGWFHRTLLFLALALRLGTDEEPQERVKHFSIVFDKNDPRQLLRVAYLDENGKEQSITPILFSTLRPVLAAQNGIELIDEADNPELIQAERDIAEARSLPMKQDLYDLQATVGLWSNCDEEEIDGWPILKFDRRRRSIQRSFDYVICAINEGAGCKFKGGNPVPSMFFDRLKTESSALSPLSTFAGGHGESAVQQQMASGVQNAPPPEFQT